MIATTQDKNNALHFAVMQSPVDLELIKKITKLGATFSPNENKLTPIDLAFQNKNLNVIEY
jgi:hypothetical protein